MGPPVKIQGSAEPQNTAVGVDPTGLPTHLLVRRRSVLLKLVGAREHLVQLPRHQCIEPRVGANAGNHIETLKLAEKDGLKVSCQCIGQAREPTNPCHEKVRDKQEDQVEIEGVLLHSLVANQWNPNGRTQDGRAEHNPAPSFPELDEVFIRRSRDQTVIVGAVPWCCSTLVGYCLFGTKGSLGTLESLHEHSITFSAQPFKKGRDG